MPCRTSATTPPPAASPSQTAATSPVPARTLPMLARSSWAPAAPSPPAARAITTRAAAAHKLNGALVAGGNQANFNGGVLYGNGGTITGNVTMAGTIAPAATINGSNVPPTAGTAQHHRQLHPDLGRGLQPRSRRANCRNPVRLPEYFRQCPDQRHLERQPAEHLLPRRRRYLHFPHHRRHGDRHLRRHERTEHWKWRNT